MTTEVNATGSHQQTDTLGRIVLDAQGNRISHQTGLESPPVASAVSSVSNVSAVMDPAFDGRVDWVWATLGTAIGQNLLDAADLDGDGDLEIITSGGGAGFGDANSVFVLDHDLNRVSCVFSLNQTLFDYHIQQLDDDNALEVLLVTADAVVEMDGATCLIESTTDFPQQAASAGLGDVDSNGVPDVVYSISGDLYKSTWNDLSDPQVRLGFGGEKVIVESLGRAGGDDIGVGAGVIFVLHGETMQTINEISGLYSGYFDFGDLDGDGTGELVGASSLGVGIAAIDISTGGEIFRYELFDLDVVHAMDVDGDGDDEVVFGEGQWGNVAALDGDGSLIHSISNPLHGVTNVLVTDFEGGGQKEVFWGAGHSFTGEDLLYRGSFASQEISWASKDFDGPFRIAMPGPYTFGSGQTIAASFEQFNSGYEIGGVLMLDAESGIPLRDYPAVDDAAWGNITTIAAANVDEDANWEICVSGDDTYDEFISCRENGSDQDQWYRPISYGYVKQLAVMDIDHNGDKELVAVSRGGQVSAYDADTGFLHWTSNSLGGSYDSTAIFDELALVDDELWLLFPSGNLRKLNPDSGAVNEEIDATPLRKIASFDGDLFAVRAGEGVGLINPESLEFESVLYSSTLEFGALVISADGRLLLAAYEQPEGQAVVIISLEGAFEPTRIGAFDFTDVQFVDWQELYLATMSGVVRIDISSLERVHHSGFEGDEES